MKKRMMNRTMRINRLSDKVEVLQCTEWMGDCNISHFMTTRFGGVSLGNFSGMNAGLYTEDAPEHVRENIRLLCDALHLSPERLFMPHQTHGAQIRILDEDFLNRSEEEQVRELEGIDALVTDVREVCVAITTADCVPVLIYAPDKQVIAAVHAGWRGIVQAITCRTISCMKQTYGCDVTRMQALVGPSISRDAFEVGNEVVDRFRQSHSWTDKEIESLFSVNPRTGKVHIDLWRAVELQLCQEGLTDGNIHLSGICTYQQVEDFFSARCFVIKSGRILSGICLRGT